MPVVGRKLKSLIASKRDGAVWKRRWERIRPIATLTKPLRATPSVSALGSSNGLMRRTKRHLYSITSSARARSVGGTIVPSALAVFRLRTIRNRGGSDRTASLSLSGSMQFLGPQRAAVSARANVRVGFVFRRHPGQPLLRQQEMRR